MQDQTTSMVDRREREGAESPDQILHTLHQHSGWEGPRQPTVQTMATELTFPSHQTDQLGGWHETLVDLICQVQDTSEDYEVFLLLRLVRVLLMPIHPPKERRVRIHPQFASWIKQNPYPDLWQQSGSSLAAIRTQTGLNWTGRGMIAMFSSQAPLLRRKKPQEQRRQTHQRVVEQAAITDYVNWHCSAVYVFHRRVQGQGKRCAVIYDPSRDRSDQPPFDIDHSSTWRQLSALSGLSMPHRWLTEVLRRQDRLNGPIYHVGGGNETGDCWGMSLLWTYYVAMRVLSDEGYDPTNVIHEPRGWESLLL